MINSTQPAQCLSVGVILLLDLVWNVWTNFEKIHFPDSPYLGGIKIIYKKGGGQKEEKERT